jgi:hypothetical protein
MPDLGPVFSALMPLLEPLVKRALGAFFKSTFGMALLCVFVAICFGVWVFDGSYLRAVAIGLFALGAGAVVTVLLSTKNAIASALLHGVSTLGVASKIATLLFDRMLSMDFDQAHGQRGTRAAQTVERLPLAAAEQRVRAAATFLLQPDPSATGIRAWLRRKVFGELMTRVEMVTLAKVRADDSAHGGVDLAKVRDELMTRMDAMVQDTIARKLRILNVLVVAGYVVATGAVGVAVRRWVP